MSKKIEQMEKDIENCREQIRKLNDRIRMLNKKILEEKKQEEVLNNKLIADAVRAIYGEVTEENIGSFVKMLKENGHVLNDLGAGHGAL